MNSISPASLPLFDGVEVVELGGAMGNEIAERIAGRVSARRVRVDGTEALRIGELFRNLPPGEQARCHIPPFGLVFFRGEEIVASASICWKCNNVHGSAGDLPLYFQFDSSGAIARELLATCKKAIAEAQANTG